MKSSPKRSSYRDHVVVIGSKRQRVFSPYARISDVRWLAADMTEKQRSICRRLSIIEEAIVQLNSTLSNRFRLLSSAVKHSRSRK